MTRPPSLLLVITVGLLCLSLLDSQQYRIALAQDQDAYAQELSNGRELLRRRNYEDALKSFKRANELRGKKSAECYNWICETYLAMGVYKNVVDAADKVIEFGGDDKQLLLKAYYNKGFALQILAERKDAKKLQAAEAAFRQALTMEGAAPRIHYYLGVSLLQLNRDPEGIAEINEYIKLQPTATNLNEVRKIVENPRRARENYAPEFSFTSAQGEHIDLEELRGKVVVLDFWATWCPPCVESVPSIRNLHKRFSKEPSFVLLGISADREDDVWREFTTEHKMIWPQYRDLDRRMQRAFRISAFPTYIVIDQEGIVRFQSEGFGWDSTDLNNAIQKEVKKVAR